MGRAGFQQPPAALVLGLGRRSWSAQPSPLVAAGSSVARARQDPCSQPGLSGLSLHFSSSASTGRALTLSLRLPSGCWPAFSCPLPSLSFLRTPPALSGRAGSPVGVARSEGSADCGGERDSRLIRSLVRFSGSIFLAHLVLSTVSGEYRGEQNSPQLTVWKRRQHNLRGRIPNHKLWKVF